MFSGSEYNKGRTQEMYAPPFAIFIRMAHPVISQPPTGFCLLPTILQNIPPKLSTTIASTTEATADINK